jgi:hypothetical protein
VTPIEAVKREVEIELDALARRVGASIPRAVTIRVEFDDRNNKIRSVECTEERRRNVLDGTIPVRAKRCKNVA